MSAPSNQSEQSSEPTQQPTLPEVYLSTRPPVTEQEAGRIHKIRNALLESETFHLSGTLDLATLGVTNPTLFYSVKDPNGDGQAARALSLLNPTVEALDLLHADADPSPFGHKKELVHDESYRLAREIRADRLGLNFDPTCVEAGILAAVAAFTAPHLDDVFLKEEDPNATGDAEDAQSSRRPINPESSAWYLDRYYRQNQLVHRRTGVEAKLYKLNSYTTGGHFKNHRDTPKATNHVGTLLFGLPAPFSGGQLNLRQPSEDPDSENINVTIDWSEPSSSSSDQSSLKLPWIFFYSDVEHEILPVTSGHRLTIAYDIFATDTVRYRVPGNPEKVNTQLLDLYNVLNAALKDGEFLVNGGKLAFALTYQYPATEMEISKTRAFDAMLKGSDYLLFHTLKALSLTPQLQAVYQPEDFPDYFQIDYLKELTDAGKKRYPADRFSSFRPRPILAPNSGRYGGERDDSAFFTAQSFMGIDSSRCESDDEPRIQLLQECVQAELDWELIWVKRPTVASWAKASTFAHYGNEPNTTFSYVAGVMIADVPPVGEGARRKS